jgi:hypothetical protein
MKPINKSSFSSGKTFLVVPLLLIILYPFFVFFDICLTHIASPDLKYESNILINTLSLVWLEIITFSILIVIFIIVLTIKANKYFNNELVITEKVTSLRNLLNFLVICVFFSHFISSIFVIINNFLAVVYLNCDQNYWLKDISIQYVFFYNKNIAGFNFLIYSIIIIVSFKVSLIRIKKAILQNNLAG